MDAPWPNSIYKLGNKFVIEYTMANVTTLLIIGGAPNTMNNISRFRHIGPEKHLTTSFYHQLDEDFSNQKVNPIDDNNDYCCSCFREKERTSRNKSDAR